MTINIKVIINLYLDWMENPTNIKIAVRKASFEKIFLGYKSGIKDSPPRAKVRFLCFCI
tara:strand:+ start:690 stop:866 length:177 start_codon:yes stop_codon:yes gene_type:complete